MIFLRNLFFAMAVLSMNNAWAQAPTVTNISPANLAIVSPDNLEIQIDFDRALDLSTVDLSNFKVSGRWTGPRKDIVFSMVNDDRTVKLLLNTEADPFNAGEWVTVYLTKGIRAGNGAYLAKGYAWNFWIATALGSLDQEKIKTIELRKPGEGLLQAYGAYAGDLNDDHFTDLTIIDETSDDLRILLNDGYGDYDAANMEIIPMGQSTPSPNEGADFNGDGDIDLAVCTAHGNELRVLFGDGDGSFYEQVNYTTGQNARGLVVLDFNGDGAEDIVIVNRGSSNMNLFTNDGTGTFTRTTIDPDPNGMGESGLAAVDANNDGIQDLFVGNYTSREIALLLGDGDGNFTLSEKVSLTNNAQPWMIAAGDFNGDGLADVASANSHGHSMTVHFGDGGGHFTAHTLSVTVPSARFPLAIDAGDLDGDGDLDLVTSNYETATFAVFENDGSGDFTTSVKLLPASDLASCAILHDRDNDGDLDITGTDEGLDHVILFENKLPTTTEAIPDEVIAFTISPNPFDQEFQVALELQETAEVQIEILDLHGRLLRQLQLGALSKGEHQFVWKGQDDRGTPLVSGVYWLQLSLGNQKVTRQLVKQ